MNSFKNIVLAIIITILSTTICYSQVQIPKAATAPVIDGQMDAIWEDAIINPINIPVELSPPADNVDFYGEFRILWDDENIYLFATVCDELIKTDNSEQAWLNDAIEIHIDGGNEKNTEIDINDVDFFYIFGKADFAYDYGDLNNYQLTSIETDIGYNYEFRFGGSDLPSELGDNLNAGTEFGLEVSIHDNDSGIRDHKLNWWSSNDMAWHTPSMWGTAVLIENFAQIQIPKTNISPVMDGDMDMIWHYAAADSIKISMTGYNPPSNYLDFSGEFRILWDQDNLYFFISVLDDNISIDNETWYENDAMSIFIDGGNEKNATRDHNDCQFAYLVNDEELTYVSIQNSGVSIDNFPNSQFISKTTHNGYNYEIRLAAADLSSQLGFDLNIGTELGLDIEMIDNDAGDHRDHILLYWSIDESYWQNPSIWGTARLTNFMLYPNKINLCCSIKFPVKSKGQDYKPEDYRMLGLPGASNILIGNLFSGKQDFDWQVYWDDGSENKNNALKEYNGDNKFCCVPGRAFWVLNKGELNINLQEITPAALDNNREITIEIHPGWNMITNPFDLPVQWSKIKEVNQITRNVPIWSFNGNWNENNQLLEPYTGYYFFNDSNITTLRIPFYIENPYLIKTKSNEDYQWKMNISLTSGKYTDKCAYLAIKDITTKGLDCDEFRKPRGVGDMLSIFFHRPEWDKAYPSFANDVRPSFTEIENWEFTVQTPSLSESRLEFSGLQDIPEEFSVYLIDHTSFDTVNLRENTSYTFTPVKQKSVFTISIGNDEAVQSKLAGILPEDYSLEQNFPNPFNPGTTIPFSLPERSVVTIKIFNIMGQEIRQLVTESYQAGKHHITWDGKNEKGNRSASGIYIVQMTTDTGKQLIGKMILLK